MLDPSLLPSPSVNPVTKGIKSPRLRMAEPGVRLEVVSPSDLGNVMQCKERRDVELHGTSAQPAKASGVTKGHWQQCMRQALVPSNS